MALPAGLLVSLGLAHASERGYSGAGDLADDHLHAVAGADRRIGNDLDVAASIPGSGLINVLLARFALHLPFRLRRGWPIRSWAMPALALMSFWGVGNAVVIYLAGLQDVPRELV